MIFLVQFGMNKHLKIFQRPKIALALRVRAILLVFEKFTRAYLFQIALEIMRLPIQTAGYNNTTRNEDKFATRRKKYIIPFRYLIVNLNIPE